MTARAKRAADSEAAAALRTVVAVLVAVLVPLALLVLLLAIVSPSALNLSVLRPLFKPFFEFIRLSLPLLVTLSEPPRFPKPVRKSILVSLVCVPAETIAEGADG